MRNTEKGRLSRISDAFLGRTEEAVRANRCITMIELRNIIP